MSIFRCHTYRIAILHKIDLLSISFHKKLLTSILFQKNIIVHLLQEKAVGRNYFIDWSLQLKDRIGVEFYLELTAAQAQDAVMEFTVDGVSTSVPGSQAVEKNGLYVFSTELAAAQLASSIAAKLTIGDAVVQTAEYTARQMAQTILDDPKNVYTVVEEDLVRAMLNYGAQAQTYFDHNTGNLANTGCEITDFASFFQEFHIHNGFLQAAFQQVRFFREVKAPSLLNNAIQNKLHLQQDLCHRIQKDPRNFLRSYSRDISLRKPFCGIHPFQQRILHYNIYFLPYYSVGASVSSI